MFAIDLTFLAIPVTLVALLVVAVAIKWFRLLPPGMASGWLVAPTIGLAAGATILACTVEEFAIRPFQLQDELLGRQLLSPLSLRSYTFWGGFGDSGWRWDYAIDADRAAELRQNGCRQDPSFPALCRLGGALDLANERSASVTLEGSTITIEEAFW